MNPTAIAELLEQLEQAEQERDRYKQALEQIANTKRGYSPSTDNKIMRRLARQALNA